MIAEGVRDKIFDAEIVSALGRALSDKDSNVGRSAINFFTAAIAQGAPRCFRGIFIPNHLQRAFGTKYLTLRFLPHLYVHQVIMIPLSEEVRSNSSLLP